MWNIHSERWSAKANNTDMRKFHVIHSIELITTQYQNVLYVFMLGILNSSSRRLFNFLIDKIPAKSTIAWPWKLLLHTSNNQRNRLITSVVPWNQLFPDSPSVWVAANIYHNKFLACHDLSESKKLIHGNKKKSVPQ